MKTNISTFLGAQRRKQVAELICRRRRLCNTYKYCEQIGNKYALASQTILAPQRHLRLLLIFCKHYFINVFCNDE